MKADLSRVTFKPERHYSRVVQQQGRPLLDADWNEQVAILHHRLQMLAADITGDDVGRSGAPFQVSGFEIRPIADQADDFEISSGRYYVDGLCCECDEDTRLTRQPLGARAEIDRNGVSLVYLEAWESLVTPLDDRALLEPALSGMETTHRMRVCWQVRTHRLSEQQDAKVPDHDALRQEATDVIGKWQSQSRGLLRARLAEPMPEAGRRPQHGSRAEHFRGPENLLYRVEVHKGGAAGEATFKWSRENGATLLALSSLSGGVATVSALSRSAAAQVPTGSWLEICDATTRAVGQAEPLVQVKTGGQEGRRLELTPAPRSRFDFDSGQRTDVALRRWDQSAGDRSGGTAGTNGMPIVEGNHEANWLELEDGIQIQFVADGKQPHHYRSGDYWLIPARTADEGMLLRAREPCAPDGVVRHYAPLALFVPQNASVIADYRMLFQPLAALQDQVNTLSATLDDLTGRVAALEKR